MSFFSINRAHDPWNERPEWCYPDEPTRKATIAQIDGLMNSFEKLYNENFEKENNDISFTQFNYINKCIANAFIEVDQTTPHLKKLSEYNSSLNCMQTRLLDLFNQFKSISDLREMMSEFDFKEKTREKVIHAYFDYTINKIALIEFTQVIDRACIKNNITKEHKFRVYTENLINEFKNVAARAGGLQVSLKDTAILLKRLQSYFPRCLDSDKKIPQLKNIKELIQLCQNLMKVATIVMQGMYADLEKRKQEHNLDQANLAHLLRQARYVNESEGDSHLYKGFGYFPMAYRLIVNLNNPLKDHQSVNQNLEKLPRFWKEYFFTEGKEQHKWREAFNVECKKVIDLVGEESLEKADKLLVNWFRPHDILSFRFGRNPDTYPI